MRPNTEVGDRGLRLALVQRKVGKERRAVPVQKTWKRLSEEHLRPESTQTSEVEK